MDINQIIAFISDMPIWAWIIGFIVIAIIFGDRRLWELEVKFPKQAGIGRGEVEFECYKKKGSSIEVEFELEDLYQNKKIEIFLNNKLVYTIPENKNNSSRLYLNKKLEIQKPNEGDEVIVNIGGQKIFNGALVRD